MLCNTVSVPSSDSRVISDNIIFSFFSEAVYDVTASCSLVGLPSNQGFQKLIKKAIKGPMKEFFSQDRLAELLTTSPRLLDVSYRPVLQRPRLADRINPDSFYPRINFSFQINRFACSCSKSAREVTMVHEATTRCKHSRPNFRLGTLSGVEQTKQSSKWR
jgi:hypothetical protein